MSLNFTNKVLKFVFSNEKGFDGGGNTLTISNIAAHVTTGTYGNATGATATVILTGLSLKYLTLLSGKGYGKWVPLASEDRISLSVYAAGTLIFKGQILSSFPNMNTLPTPTLILNAVTAYEARNDSFPAFSTKKPTTVRDVLSATAERYGYALTISPSAAKITVSAGFYLSGSTYDKIRELCYAYDLWFTIKDKTLTVWRLDEPVDGLIPFVSAKTGLVGYPLPNQSGVSFQTTFSPLLAQGRRVQLETTAPNLSGYYTLYQVEHVLSSWIEGGPWHTACQGFIYDK